MVWKFQRSDVFLCGAEASGLRSFPIFCTPKVVKMTLRVSKSRKRGTFRENFFWQSCSYNLPQHFMFWWPSLNLKSEITILKNVEKRHFYRFLTSPILQKIEYAENFAKQTCVAHIDDQLWYHEGFVNVKFEGSKVRKTSKKRHFYDSCKFDICAK